MGIWIWGDYESRVLTSGFVFALWVFCSLVSVSSLAFSDWDGCALPVLLACSDDVFTGSAAGVGG